MGRSEDENPGAGSMNAHLYQARKGGPPAGFAGGFWDAENNADHFGAREYEKTHGQWLTPDPAGLAAVDITNPQTWNRYAYVTNDPLSYVDPSGLFRAAPGQCQGGQGICPDEGGGADPTQIDGGEYIGSLGSPIFGTYWNDGWHTYISGFFGDDGGSTGWAGRSNRNWRGWRRQLRGSRSGVGCYGDGGVRLICRSEKSK